MSNLVSIKGEDVLLSTPTTQMVKYHRYRASVPSKLWRWRIVTGWTWRGQPEHINCLEMRAILTAIKWRICHHHHVGTRLLHLTDSLVALRCLSRGRSSSRKLRRVVCRTNALLLAGSCQALWGYVHTDQNPADKPSHGGVGGFAPNLGKMPKRFLEGATVAARKQQRQSLGTLRNLTVQPATRARYQKAVDHFLQFLKHEGLTVPHRRDDMDPVVCDYLEHLWSSGMGRAQASDCLAGLQNNTPGLRGRMPGAWRLLKAWHMNEIPNRAPPLPVRVVHAMAGWAMFSGHPAFAVSLLIGFYSMLRTGEILSLKRSHFSSPPGSSRVVISLGMTKGGRRTGAAESSVLGYDVAVRFVQRWMSLARGSISLTPSPAKWRQLFNDALAALNLTQYEFRPYSLRRGGATFWFTKHGSFDTILVQGRWQTPKTARIYLNEGLSVLAELSIPQTDPRISAHLAFFNSHKARPLFTNLEPLQGRSTGGRGKDKKFSKKKPKKASKPSTRRKIFLSLSRL